MSSELGDCYQVAWKYFFDNCYRNKNLRLVHGLVTGQGKIEGIIYNHAWVEDIKNHRVYDYTMPKSFQVTPSDLYYRLGRVQQTYKYDSNQVLDKATKLKTYGPWEDELWKYE